MNIFEIFAKLNTQEKCIKYLEQKRWNGKPICPYCKSEKTSKHLHRHQCQSCNKSFSVTVGTIFHNTHIELQKWFLVIAMMLNAKKGISACQIARDLDMRRPTVWSMMHRIRKAMTQDKDFLQGIVEVDETYIGGKPRANEHRKRNKDDDNNSSGGSSKKSVIFGMVERKGKIKAVKVDDAKRNTLMPHILDNIKKDSSIMSDENKVYHYLYVNYKHETVNHSKLEFVRNNCHTNTMEGFWSLLKRGIKGQFHHISKKYTNRYINEFCWRYNNKDNDSVFDKLVGNMLVF